jgi:membrane-bound serine protease (ClpP class)
LVASIAGAFLCAQDPPVAEDTEVRRYQRGVVIPITGELTPLAEQSFRRRLDDARNRQADLVVVELDSPGGYVDTSLEIADMLLRVDWARTVAYVPRQAMSGAAIVSLGCDETLMSPIAQFGDAGMIQLSLEDAGFRYAPEKARSALVAKVRTLAEAKGRPPALAEALVDMDLVVYRVRNTQSGKETFMSDAEIDASPDPGQWEKLRPVLESREKHFLTLNGKQAVDLQLAHALVDNREELQTHYGLRQALVELPHTRIDTIVLILNHPIITGLIFVIGLVALYVEFSMPGTFVGGLVAGLCFSIFFWSRFLGGTAGWLEVVLFVAGLAFIMMELFVIPGFGFSGVIGLLLVISSVIMASQAFFLPHNSRELNTTLTQMAVVGTSGFLFVLAAVACSRYLGAIPVMKGLMLEVPRSSPEPSPSDATAATVSANANSAAVPTAAGGNGLAIGSDGIADSALRPAGKVRFGNRYVDVVSDGGFVDRGRHVRVIEIAGNRVVVRVVESASG